MRSFRRQGFLVTIDSLSQRIYVEGIKKFNSLGTAKAFERILDRHHIEPNVVVVDGVFLIDLV